MNSLQDDKEITFENFCDKYKLIYSVKPYTFDKKQNVSAANDIKDFELLATNMRMSICEMG